jgi:hypothetical protein
MPNVTLEAGYEYVHLRDSNFQFLHDRPCCIVRNERTVRRFCKGIAVTGGIHLLLQ